MGVHVAKEYKGLYVQFEGDSTSLSAALGKINASARKTQGELRAINKAAKFDSKNPALLADSIELARKRAEECAKKFDVLKQAEEQMASSGDRSAEELQKIARSADLAKANLKAAQKVLLDYEKASTMPGKASEVLGEISEKASKLSDKLSDAGGALARGVTVPLAAAAAYSVKSATDVDTALTNVRKTTDMTSEGYEQLRQSAIELSRTQPVTAADILNIESMGAQLGWSNDELEGFAKTVSGLDIATDMDAETAATQLAQFANITRMAQGDADRYGSSIVALGNNMATTESRISDMAQNMASAATQAGMSQADILGLSAAASSLGLEAEAGGTAFSRTITDISTQVSTNGEELQKWADLAHMSTEEFRQSWQMDATGTFEAVINGMAEVQQNGGDLNVTLADLGITETRQSDFLRRMAGNTDLVTRAVQISNDAWQSNTALSDEVANRNESVASKMQVLKNRIDAVAAEVGGPLIDAAEDALTAAEPLFEAIESGARSFSEMSTSEQAAIIKAVAFAAALGPMLSGLGKVSQGISVLAKVGSRALDFAARFSLGMNTASEDTLEASKSIGGLAGKLGALANPMTRVTEGASRATIVGSRFVEVCARLLPVVGGAALGLAIGTLANGLFELAIGFGTAQKAAEDAVSGASAWAESASQVQGVAVDTQTAFADTGKSASTLQQTASDAISTITSTIESETSQWGTITQDGVDEIKRAFETLNDTQPQVAQAFGNVISNLQSQMGSLDSGNVKQYIADVGSAFDQGKSQLDSTLQQQLQVIEAYHRQLGDEGSDAYNSDVQAAKDAYNQSLAALDGYRNDALSKTSDMYGQLSDETAEGWRKLESFTAGKKNLISAFFNSGFSSTVSEMTQKTFNELTSQIDYGVTGAWLAAQAATVEAGGQLDDATKANVASMLAAFSDLPADLQDQGTDSMRALAEAMEQGGVDLGDISSMTGQQIVDAMKDKLGIMTDDAGQSINDIIDKFDALNGIELDPKQFTVNDDGTITDMSGKVWDLDAMTIDGKYFFVNDDGTISIMGTNVDHLDAQQVAEKDFTITDNGTSASANQSVDSVRNNNIPRKDFDVRANDYASGVLQTIKSWLDSLHDKIINVTTRQFTSGGGGGAGGGGGGGAFASGAIISGGQPLRLHASGFIAASPMLISRRDLVGEAGAEAIIPLTNRRYTSPFAHTVAEELAGIIGGQQPAYVDNRRTITNNVYEREDAYVAADILTRRMLS